MSLSRTFNGVQFPYENFFVSQQVTLCEGSTFRFSVTYYLQLAALVNGGECYLRTSLDGMDFGPAPKLVTIPSGAVRTWVTSEAEIVATAASQNFTLRIDCLRGVPRNNYYNFFMDNLSLMRIDP